MARNPRESENGTQSAEPSQNGQTKPARPAPPAEKSRLHQRYERDVVPALVRDFNYQNPMQVPRLSKVSVNVGVGEAIANAKALDATVRDVSIITGQKPIVKKARKSIAQFKLREGQNVGVMVTLRGERMWEFLDRLMNAALPRTRDFRGVPSRSFDGRGNFTLGLREQLIFPEISYDQVDRARGLEVSIITTASTDQEARRLLELLGMPFQREGEAAPAVAARRPATRRRR
ncbi:MAG: 50S ribosomal protein L5 [Chloroflexi bacterium]|nr:50S ribosomal protein L5 [Chloroflexota bacterium]